MKGQYGIIPMIVGGILTLIIASVMIYAVFFPVTTNLNTNTSVTNTNQNLTADWMFAAPKSIIFPSQNTIVNEPTIGTATLVVYYGPANVSSGSAAINVTVDGYILGNMPASNSNTSATFTNISTLMLASPPITIQFINVSTAENYTILNTTLTYNQNIFGNIQANQQSNFGVVLLLAGILVIIVALVVFLMITKSVS
jgi:hypothetical protein